eukprot:scaffold44029_cov39-Prasinocladus_malaysianus.AAC.1
MKKSLRLARPWVASYEPLSHLHVAAYTNGRSSVTEVDCLLLQHVLWDRPDLADRIYDWILGQLAIDDGLKQVS